MSKERVRCIEWQLYNPSFHSSLLRWCVLADPWLLDSLNGACYSRKVYLMLVWLFCWEHWLWPSPLWKCLLHPLPLSAGSFPWTPTGCLHVLLYCCCEAHLRLSDSLHWCVCLIKLLAKLLANSLFFYCQPGNNQPVLDEGLQTHKRWVRAWLWIIWRCFYSNRATLLWLKKLGKVY